MLIYTLERMHFFRYRFCLFTASPITQAEMFELSLQVAILVPWWDSKRRQLWSKSMMPQELRM